MLIGETVDEGQQDANTEDSPVEDVKNALTDTEDSISEDDENNDEEDQEDGEEEESGKKITHLSYKGGSRCIYWCTMI